MAEKLYTQREMDYARFEQGCYSLALGIIIGNIMSILIQAILLK